MRTTLRIIFFVSICCSFSYAESDSGGFCKIYEISEAEGIKAGCPLITDQDFIDTRKQCEETKKKLSPECQLQQGSLQSQVSELGAAYQKYLSKKQNSFESDKSLLNLMESAKGIVDKIENLSTASRCDVSSSVISLLPVAAMINAPAGLILGGGGELVSRVIKLFKKQKLSISSKLALCNMNESFASARSEACLTLEMSDPVYKEVIKHDLYVSESLCKAADSKYVTVLKKVNELESSLKGLSLMSGTDSSKVRVEFLAEDLKEILSSVKCDNPANASICENLKFLDSALKDRRLLDSRSDTKDRQELVLKMNRIVKDLSRDLRDSRMWEKPGSNRPHDWPDDTWNIALTGEPAGKAFESNLCDGVNPDVTDLLKRQINDNLNFTPAGRMVKDAFEQMPDKMEGEVNNSRLCQALVCVWGPATSNPEPSKRAKSGKDLHPKGWDPLAKQDINTYIRAGAAVFQSWDIVLKEKKKFFSQLSEKCKSHQGICNITCRESDEEILKRRGGVIRTDRAGKTSVILPTRMSNGSQ